MMLKLLGEEVFVADFPLSDLYGGNGVDVTGDD
jgi:hypothetical protein